MQIINFLHVTLCEVGLRKSSICIKLYKIHFLGLSDDAAVTFSIFDTVCILDRRSNKVNK